MAEVGLLAPDARIELIEGAIIDMAPIGNPHNSVVDRLVQWLIPAVSGEAIVRAQGSFRLSDILDCRDRARAAAFLSLSCRRRLFRDLLHLHTWSDGVARLGREDARPRQAVAALTVRSGREQLA
jgi:hypothetical protein